MNSERFQQEAENLLQILLDFYTPYFTVTRDFMLSETRLNALAEYHSREERNFFGVKMNKLGPEANEYGMYWFVEDFTPAALKQATELLEAAEHQLVKLHPAHGSSILSMIVFAGQVFDGAGAALKKYRMWKNYNKLGILTVRLVVIDVNDRNIYYSKDARELKNLLQKAMEGKKIL